MRTLAASFLIVGFWAGAAYAECSYFRVAVHLLKCVPADANTMKTNNPYLPVPEAPELEDPHDNQVGVQVVCACDYTLKGSDVRCDMDQTIEKTSVIGGDKPTETCHRGRTLCNDLCPSRLP
jgi:hypothetical protein